MDMNGHINNVTYLGWALETVPADVYLNYSLQEVLTLPTLSAMLSYPCALTFRHIYAWLNMRRALCAG